MGRGRLRRGYSLEVIFEEDSDFGSALNSLDSFTLGNSKRNSTTTTAAAAIEEEAGEDFHCAQSRSRSRSTSLNFSPLLSQSRTSNHSINIRNQNSGSGRSGPCASGGFKSFDGFLDTSDMDSCYIEWDEFSGDSLMSKGGAEERRCEDIESRNASNSNGRRSRVSRRQIVEANWLIDDEDDCDHAFLGAARASDSFLTQTSSTVYCPPPPPPINTNPAACDTINPDAEDIFGDRGSMGFTAADAEFFDDHEVPMSLLLTDETYAAIDTFDEVNSTISASTCSLSGAAAGINLNGSDDKPSNSGSMTSVSISPYSSVHKNGINNERIQLSPASSLSGKERIKKSSSVDSDSPITDVKRVRALFENSSSNICAAAAELETNSSSGTSSQSPFSSWKKSPMQKKTDSLFTSTSKTSLLSAEDRDGSDLNLSGSSRRSSTTSSPLIRSAYSQLQLNQMEKYEFVDLLVNDNIIIEDSPDLFQKQRSRFPDMDRVKGSQSNLPAPDHSNKRSSLRRSKSVGAGLHKGDGYDADTSSSEDIMKSRPCILAEELPAPDTVKNARNVFEKLLHKEDKPSDSACVIITPKQRNSNIFENSKENMPKRTLSSIKSNPTSKILRSESMRDNSITCSRFGKPILLNGYSPPLPTQTQTSTPKFQEQHTETTVKRSETAHQTFTYLVNGTANKSLERENTNRQHQKRTFEIGKRTDSFPSVTQSRDNRNHREPDSHLSLGSSLGTMAGDDDEPKMISPDVLHKIRSYGTTTTYFGGEIVAKTVRNRNLILPPSKLESSVQESVEIVIAPPNEIFYSARPNQSEKSSTKPGVNHTSNGNRNGSGIDFTSFRFMDFESPSSRLSRHPEDEDIPRIISVEPKSQPNSPTKSNSPTVGMMMGSIIAEGRNSPEGCESNASVSSSCGAPEQTINNEGHAAAEDAPKTTAEQMRKKGDGNNNCIKTSASAETSAPKPESLNGCDHEDGESTSSKKFSEAAEGAWF